MRMDETMLELEKTQESLYREKTSVDTPQKAFKMTHYFVYYDAKNMNILEFFPSDLSETLKSSIINHWSKPIAREILIALSREGDLNAPGLKKIIGHSMSTLHENIRRLEQAKLIEAKMIYKGNKQKILSPVVLFVTKKSDLKAHLGKFFQGLWVDTQTSQKIVDFLNAHPDKHFVAEEISAKTHIPVDQVNLILNNWDSFITKPISSAFKGCPFEKKISYRAKRK